MPIVIAVAFLLFLSLSGGLSGGLAGAATSDDSASTSFAASAESAKVSPEKTVPKKTITNFWKPRSTTSAAAPTYRVPSVYTEAALNIEDTNASLRGAVDMYVGKNGVAFVAYGYNLKSVRDVTAGYKTYSAIPVSTDDKVRTYVLDRRASGQEEYNRRITSLVPDTNYYYKVCVEYDTAGTDRAITCGSVKMFTTNSRYTTSKRFREPSVRAARATSITANSALLEGTVNMNDGIDGITFFVYGQSREDIGNVENFKSYNAIDELGDDLQKNRTSARVLGQATYKEVVEDLDNDEEYYYRFCAEYTGEEDGLVCSGVGNFTTDRRNRSVLPYAETTSASVVAGKVTFRSLIQMNDYLDGVAFVIVGTDGKRVAAVADEESFAQVRQSGYALQKILLDSNTDATKAFTKTINFLEPGTYSYRTCVQYRGEDDNNRERDYLRCSEVKTLTVY